MSQRSGQRLTPRSVLLVVMDDVEGPIIADQQPEHDFVSKKSFFDHFQPFLIPKSDLTKRLQWLYAPSQHTLVLYYPDELRGNHYDRFTFRFCLAFAFSTCHNFMFLPPYSIERELSPYIVSLTAMAEVLRDMEGRHGYLAWALNEKRWRSIGSGKSIVAHSQRRDGGGRPPALLVPSGSLSNALRKEISGVGEGGSGGVGKSVNNENADRNAGGINGKDTVSSKNNAAINRRIRDAEAVARAENATEEDGTRIQWTPLEDLLLMLFRCLVRQGSVVAVSTTHHFHIRPVPLRCTSTALSARHTPFAVAVLNPQDVADIVLCDVYNAIDGIKTVRGVGRALGLDIHTTLEAIEYLVFARYVKVLAPVTPHSCFVATRQFLSSVVLDPTHADRLDFVAYMSARQEADGKGAYGREREVRELVKKRCGADDVGRGDEEEKKRLKGGETLPHSASKQKNGVDTKVHGAKGDVYHLHLLEGYSTSGGSARKRKGGAKHNNVCASAAGGPLEEPDESTLAAALMKFVSQFQYRTVYLVQQMMRGGRTEKGSPPSSSYWSSSSVASFSLLSNARSLSCDSSLFEHCFGRWCDRAVRAAVEFAVLKGWLEHVGWASTTPPPSTSSSSLRSLPHHSPIEGEVSHYHSQHAERAALMRTMRVARKENPSSFSSSSALLLEREGDGHHVYMGASEDEEEDEEDPHHLHYPNGGVKGHKGDTKGLLLVAPPGGGIYGGERERGGAAVVGGLRLPASLGVPSLQLGGEGGGEGGGAKQTIVGSLAIPVGFCLHPTPSFLRQNVGSADLHQSFTHLTLSGARGGDNNNKKEEMNVIQRDGEEMRVHLLQTHAATATGAASSASSSVQHTITSAAVTQIDT